MRTARSKPSDQVLAASSRRDRGAEVAEPRHVRRSFAKAFATDVPTCTVGVGSGWPEAAMTTGADVLLARPAVVRHTIHMIDSATGRALILAAGGIVVREGPKPRIAVVRLRRDKAWVLPKGKLGRGERAVDAAKREVLEETGCRVSVHEFLGSMAYAFNGKIKIVQFWHMRAVGEPVGKLTSDVKAVKWLSLRQAIETLTRAHEKVFLANVGPAALKTTRRSKRAKSAKTANRDKRAAKIPASRRPSVHRRRETEEFAAAAG